MWPEFSPPSSQRLLLQLLEHVPVADFRARQRDALARQRVLEAEVAHQRADDTAVGDLPALVVGGDHVQQLVAVVERAFAVGHDQAVAVAVERHAQVGAMSRAPARPEIADASPRRRH